MTGVRRRWVPYAAAAAVLVVVGAVTAVGTTRDDDRGDGSSAGGALPAPEPGHRWVSWRDVAVQVPTAWVYDNAPGEDWCADADGHGEANPTPYVDTVRPGFGVTLAIGCLETPEPGRPAQLGPAPERLWQTHLSFVEPRDVQDEVTWEGWTYESRTLGDAGIVLVTDDPGATAAILDSATRFSVDHHGCAASSPAQATKHVRPPGFDVTTISAVEAISVCQYDRRRALGTPALMGSRRLTGAEADDLLRGLQEAPAGGGPDRPSQCTADLYGDTVVVVRLHQPDRTDDVYVYFDHCFGNGSDDGRTKRELTADTCAPLFEQPVVPYRFMSSLHGKCAPDS